MSANQEMFRLWQTSMRMAMEMPWVVGQRMCLFSQPWDDKTVAEYQLMFTEKAEGFTEAWGNWLNASTKQTPLLLKQPLAWRQYERLLQQSLYAVNQGIKPLSKRVHANHSRLKP